MNRMWIYILLFSFISCKSTSEKKVDIVTFQSRLEDGTLTLSTGNNTQVLKEKGVIVDFHTTPDQKTIALEIAKFSNISVMEIYTWDDASKEYIAQPSNINKKAWDRLANKQGIDPSELISSHVYFLSWKTNNSISLELRGRTEKGRFISDTVTLVY